MSYNDGVNSTGVHEMPQAVDAYNNKESDEEGDEHGESVSISRKKVK